MAGFIPTYGILRNESIVKFKVDQLLYIGGLSGCLKSLNSSKNNQYLALTDSSNNLLAIEIQILQVYLNFPEHREWIFNTIEGDSKKSSVDDMEFCINFCRVLWRIICQFKNNLKQKEIIIENVRSSELLVEFILKSIREVDDSYSVKYFWDYLINLDKTIIDKPIYTVKRSIIKHHIIFNEKKFDDWINKLKSSDIIANTGFGYACCSELFEVQTRILTLKKELENLDLINTEKRAYN